MENYHIVEVRYLGPTDFRGSRVKFKSHRFGDSVIFPFNYETDTIGTAKKAFEAAGVELFGLGEFEKGYFLMLRDFRPLKEIFGRGK